MRLAWATDIHLNFLDAAARRGFLESLGKQAGAVAISGDIGESPDIEGHLLEMEEVLQRPIYFVLGNHDFYHGSPLDAVRGKGYPVFYVEVDGFTFQFASLDEMRVCIDTLGTKLLPNTLRLARDQGGNSDEHWLRKMPDHTKPWRYREKAVKYLTKALRSFERQRLEHPDASSEP
jgi:hypothetical protein